MYNYGSLIDILVYDEEIKKEDKEQQLISKQQHNREEEKVNRQHHDSFCMLTNFMADRFANTDDKLDMVLKAQAGTRQQISELHSMLNELLFRERSK